MILLFMGLLVVTNTEKLKLDCSRSTGVHEVKFGERETRKVEVRAEGVSCVERGQEYEALNVPCACDNDDSMDKWHYCKFRCVSRHARGDDMLQLNLVIVGRTEMPELAADFRTYTARSHRNKRSVANVKKATISMAEWRLDVMERLEKMRDTVLRHWIMVPVAVAALRLRSGPLRTAILGFAAVYVSTYAFNPAEACSEVLQGDVVTGVDMQQVWIHMDEEQCVSIGLEAARRPLKFQLGEGKISQGIKFEYLLPMKTVAAARSAGACPGAEITLRADSLETCHKDEVPRGWGNGCFLFGTGTAETCVRITSTSKSAMDYAWVFSLSDVEVVSEMTVGDSPQATETKAMGS